MKFHAIAHGVLLMIAGVLANLVTLFAPEIQAQSDAFAYALHVLATGLFVGGAVEVHSALTRE